MPDNPPSPPICVECHRPIIVLITAVTPRNPRRHIVAVPSCYIRTGAGPVCPSCWEATQDERDLVADVADAYGRALDPVTIPDDTPPELLRVYTRNGKVIRTEPLTAQANDRQNGRGK